MNNYWENRYSTGGNSGAGSYGEYAKHKSDVINKYINDYNIKTISDFGCGDGNQITLIKGYSKYNAYDISESAIRICQSKFKNNTDINFHSSIQSLPNSELCLSLDVIYHIIDDKEYEYYLSQLFNKSTKYVLIFSSNHTDNQNTSLHLKHRKFTDMVDIKYSNFKLIDEIDNNLVTTAKFFLFKK